jgi:uncharacterized repeat protein (TIGR03833 family)
VSGNTTDPESPHRIGTHRDQIKVGMVVLVVLKADQATGKLTRGVVREILTHSRQHPHGIKVRLQDGQVGRVKEVVSGAG